MKSIFLDRKRYYWYKNTQIKQFWSQNIK